MSCRSGAAGGFRRRARSGGSSQLASRRPHTTSGAQKRRTARRSSIAPTPGAGTPGRRNALSNPTPKTPRARQGRCACHPVSVKRSRQQRVPKTPKAHTLRRSCCWSCVNFPDENRSDTARARRSGALQPASTQIARPCHCLLTPHRRSGNACVDPSRNAHM